MVRDWFAHTLEAAVDRSGCKSAAEVAADKLVGEWAVEAPPADAYSAAEPADAEVGVRPDAEETVHHGWSGKTATAAWMEVSSGSGLEVDIEQCDPRTGGGRLQNLAVRGTLVDSLHQRVGAGIQPRRMPHPRCHS